MDYYLSLGSNIGDRFSFLKEAIRQLRNFGEVLKYSPVYETKPLGMKEGVNFFLNMTALFKCEFSPEKFQKEIKRIEQRMGRDLKNSHLQSREIDIDILFANDLILSKKKLTIPHPSISQRAFVLFPLNDIVPDYVHPVLKKSIRELLEDLRLKNPDIDTLVACHGELF